MIVLNRTGLREIERVTVHYHPPGCPPAGPARLAGPPPVVPDRASRLLSLRRLTACISEPSSERSGKQADNDCQVRDPARIRRTPRTAREQSSRMAIEAIRETETHQDVELTL